MDPQHLRQPLAPPHPLLPQVPQGMRHLHAHQSLRDVDETVATFLQAPAQFDVLGDARGSKPAGGSDNFRTEAAGGSAHRKQAAPSTVGAFQQPDDAGVFHHLEPGQEVAGLLHPHVGGGSRHPGVPGKNFRHDPCRRAPEVGVGINHHDQFRREP